MHRERISENVFWFQSEIYAQVTAGVVVGPQWAVVIDTLALPEETLAIRNYIEQELAVPVRYVIDTHHHADHSWGNGFFPDASVIGHSACRRLLLEEGGPALEQARRANPGLKSIKLVPPEITFDSGTLSLRVGKRNLVMAPMPGHSADGISVLIEEDRILFAGDSFLPLPVLVGGSLDATAEAVKAVGKMGLENIVQGHGDIILRGEIEDACKENLAYLNALRKTVKAALRRRDPEGFLEGVDVESCGKSRVHLSGLASELHQRNLRYLYRVAIDQAGSGVELSL